MDNPATAARFTPQFVADIQQVLEKHGYRLPDHSTHIRELVLARVEYALHDVVERFEGRIA